MSDVRRRVEDIAAALHAAAVDSFAKGMALLERATRVRTLATVANDSQLEDFLRQIDGDPDFIPRTTAPGGKA